MFRFRPHPTAPPSIASGLNFDVPTPSPTPRSFPRPKLGLLPLPPSWPRRPDLKAHLQARQERLQPAAREPLPHSPPSIGAARRIVGRLASLGGSLVSGDDRRVFSRS
jgi:hypothetical protein